MKEQDEFDLIATDPPYTFGGGVAEYEITATVAIVLREAAMRLRKDRYMVVMSATSWRSISYMVESVRGICDPIRIGAWCKPAARTRVKTSGWSWATVAVTVFRKGTCSGIEYGAGSETMIDNIAAEVIKRGRRAQLPPSVADWMVRPFAVPGGRMLDPFAGSGAIVEAGTRAGMRAVGYEKNPASDAA